MPLPFLHRGPPGYVGCETRHPCRGLKLDETSHGLYTKFNLRWTWLGWGFRTTCQVGFSWFALIFIYSFVLRDATHGKINRHRGNFVSGSLSCLKGMRTVVLGTEKFHIQIVSRLNSFPLYSFLSEQSAWSKQWIFEMQAQATDKENTITTSPKDTALKGGSHLCAFRRQY